VNLVLLGGLVCGAERKELLAVGLAHVSVVERALLQNNIPQITVEYALNHVIVTVHLSLRNNKKLQNIRNVP